MPFYSQKVLNYPTALNLVIGEQFNAVMLHIFNNFHYNYILDDENVTDPVKLSIVCMENTLSLPKCVIIIRPKQDPRHTYSPLSITCSSPQYEKPPVTNYLSKSTLQQ